MDPSWAIVRNDNFSTSAWGRATWIVTGGSPDRTGLGECPWTQQVPLPLRQACDCPETDQPVPLAPREREFGSRSEAQEHKQDTKELTFSCKGVSLMLMNSCDVMKPVASGHRCWKWPRITLQRRQWKKAYPCRLSNGHVPGKRRVAAGESEASVLQIQERTRPAGKPRS